MSEETIENGEDTGHEDSSSEYVDDAQGEELVEEKPDRFSELQGQLGEVTNALSMIQSQFGALQEQLAPKPSKPTASDLNELLRTDPAQALGMIVDERNQQLERRLSGNISRKTWDEKAHRDFPMSDPKFAKDLQQTWNYMRQMGLSADDPKSMYLAAEVAAVRFGHKNKGQNSSSVNQMSGESSTPKTAPKRKSSVAENDPRLVTYMRTNPSKEKLEKFKTKLNELDRSKRERRG
jgi:hypothetical protein